MSAIDDWLDGDADEAALIAALADPAARRDLVDLALADVLLARAPAAPRRRFPRTAAIVAGVVVVAMIAVLLWPRPRELAVQAPALSSEPGARVVAAGPDRTTLADGGTVIAVTAPHVVETPFGDVALAPNTRATLRASASPAALYVEVAAGSVTIERERQTLRAGERGIYGDRVARRRLGPRVHARILAIDAARVEVELSSGAHATYKISATAEYERTVAIGDTVELVLSLSENEVFVLR